MKTSFAKSFMFTLTLLALMFSGLGVTPAYAAAAGTANPTSWNAGTVAIGVTVTQTITLTNTSGVIINTLTMVKSITGSSDFKFQTQTSQCPMNWNGIDPCYIYIKFIPSGAGPRTANLSIYFPGYDTINIPLSGTGAGPAVSMNPTSWDFGTQSVGNPSGVKSFTLTNSGTQSLNLGTLSVTGTNANNFALSGNTCNGTTVAAAGTCTFGVTFTPTSTGVKSGSISIPSNIPTVTVPLSGMGATSAPAVSLAPAPSWDFGNQNVGSTSAANSFTLTNTGTANLNVGTLTTSGEFAFSSNTCNNATVTPAGTCSFGVTFSPTSAGVKSGSVSIPSNIATATVSLSGTGVDAPQVLERSKNGGVNTYTGTSKVPTSWVKSATFATTDGKDTTVKKEGIASVKIVGVAGKIKTLTQSIILSGLSGDTFTFTFWAKGASIPTAGICRAQVFLYNGTTLTLTKTINCRTGTYSAFQQKTLTFNATSAYTKVVIKFTYSKASGTVWFDLVSLLR
jgi:hypothetical protein